MGEKFLITGGAGFIGSAFCRFLINKTNNKAVIVDKFSYGSNKNSLSTIKNSKRVKIYAEDLCEYEAIKKILIKENPDKIIHFAAETHVDHSIENPKKFFINNLLATFNLLEIAKHYYTTYHKNKKFLFHHVSTDEVFGDSFDQSVKSTESSAYLPNSPYSATKAGSDHLVRAWGKTFCLPVTISYSSNNFGSFQANDKLIPKVIKNAIEEKTIPIYGDGLQKRNWIYVDDNVSAIYKIATKSSAGEKYNIAGINEITNIDVVKMICKKIDYYFLKKYKILRQSHKLIRFVNDRVAHDKVYSIDSSKIRKKFKWNEVENFESNLEKTIKWYFENSVLDLPKTQEINSNYLNISKTKENGNFLNI